MARFALAALGIASVVAAFVIDWRAGGLMVVGWWFDNMLKRLNERDRP